MAGSRNAGASRRAPRPSLAGPDPAPKSLSSRWERDRDRVSAPVENGSRHLRFAGYDPPALSDEEDDHVPRP